MRTGTVIVVLLLFGAAPARADPAAGQTNFRADLRGTSQSDPLTGKETGRLPGRVLDASEGTARDPLANRSWDLSSPKTIPPSHAAAPDVAVRRTR